MDDGDDDDDVDEEIDDDTDETLIEGVTIGVGVDGMGGLVDDMALSFMLKRSCNLFFMSIISDFILSISSYSLIIIIIKISINFEISEMFFLLSIERR